MSRKNPSLVHENQLTSIIKSFLRLTEWCDELLCSYKGRSVILEEMTTMGSDLYQEDTSLKLKARKKLRRIEAWLPNLEDLCENLHPWANALQVVENQFDKTDMGYLIFVEKLAQITLSGWQSYNVIAGEKMGTSEKQWQQNEARYQIGSLNSNLDGLDKALTLMKESEGFFRIQNDILKIIAKSGAKGMIDESRAEKLDLDLWGRRRNPRRKNPQASSLGSIAVAGIAGFLLGKK